MYTPVALLIEGLQLNSIELFVVSAITPMLVGVALMNELPFPPVSGNGQILLCRNPEKGHPGLRQRDDHGGQEGHVARATASDPRPAGAPRSRVVDRNPGGDVRRGGNR